MTDLTARPTQAEFGTLVGISQPAVSDLLTRGVLQAGGTAGEWLTAYCAHLREVAAGRAAEGGVDLATERARLAREQADKIGMQNAVTRGELAPRALLVEVLTRTAPKVCGLLDAIVPQLRRRSGYSAEDLAYVAEVIAKARNEVAGLTLDEVMAEGGDDELLDVEEAA